MKNIESVSDYLELISFVNTSYLTSESTPTEILEAQIINRQDGLEYGGVRYEDFQTLLFSDNWYPITNQPDYLFQSNLAQLNNIHTPFIDHRVLDLHLSIPLKYQIRGQLIREAVNAVNPELAAIPHPNTGLSLDRPFVVQYATRAVGRIMEKFSDQDFPKPHYTDTAWYDKEELIRTTDFVSEKLAEHQNLIQGIDIFDAEKTRELYRAHESGEYHGDELYRLLTVLEMPITARIANNDR